MRQFMRRALPGTRMVFTLVVLSMTVAGCAGNSTDQTEPATAATLATSAPEVPDPLVQAAAEATAIVQQAQATAMVLQAEAQAAEMIQEATGPEDPDRGSEGQPTGQDPAPADTPMAPSQTAQASSSGPAPPGEPEIKVISVGFAGEGGFIHVQFMAPPGVARRWNQGLVSVTDEETGVAYTEIPIMPVVGALIGKPIREGQPGYVMLVNGPVPISSGATVTVKLGNHVEEGITVQ